MSEPRRQPRGKAGARPGWWSRQRPLGSAEPVPWPAALWPLESSLAHASLSQEERPLGEAVVIPARKELLLLLSDRKQGPPWTQPPQGTPQHRHGARCCSCRAGTRGTRSPTASPAPPPGTLCPSAGGRGRSLSILVGWELGAYGTGWGESLLAGHPVGKQVHCSLLGQELLHGTRSQCLLIFFSPGLQPGNPAGLESSLERGPGEGAGSGLSRQGSCQVEWLLLPGWAAFPLES